MLFQKFKINNFSDYKMSHADELSFLFFSDVFGSIHEFGPSEEKISKMMLKMWTNFAKYG